MIVVAGLFGSFLLFGALGLLALLVTAALDKPIGKERALLLYVVGILALAWALRPTAPPPARPAPKQLSFTSERTNPTFPVRPGVDPFAHEPLSLRGARNAFQEMSDTNPLPPERLDEPPEEAIPFPLAPTVPGVGFAARAIYRGARPVSASPAPAADGSADAPVATDASAAPAAVKGAGMPEIPSDGFTSYVESPEDVYDWMVDGGQKVFIHIRAIDDAKEGTPAFDDPVTGLKWMLASGEAAPGSSKVWADLNVSFSYVGSEADARKKLDRTSRVKVRQTPPSSIAAGRHEGWRLRRTVANELVAASRRQGRARVQELGVEQLRAVAAEMARIGETGKENGAGWVKAIEVLQLALERSRRPPGRDATDVLLALIDAYRARQNEKDLIATLTEYLATTRTASAEAEGARWLGDVYLSRLRLPDRALAEYSRAISAAPGSKAALEGRGDAFSYLGEHERARKDYRAASDAGGRASAGVREAEALLRLGRLAEARTAADAALAAGAFDPRALLVKGAVQYALGDVQGASDTFRQAIVLPSDPASRRHRAEALYDFGLCEWRLGRSVTADAAFDAVEAALRRGSSRGRSPDETVSPELGRALIHLSAGRSGEAHDALDRARDLAPGLVHVDVVAGVVAHERRDTAEALLRFEAALALAPDLFEFDPWLAETRLRVAEDAVREGVPPSERAADFQAAVRYAERAARREAAVDARRTDFAVREALVRLRQQHLSDRKRYEAALKTAEAILARTRDERRALVIKGYCNYRLGIGEPARYAECIRNFQAVLEVNAPADDPWKAYAARCLDVVTRWQALAEKIVEFAEIKLSSDWETGESHGIRVNPERRRDREDDGMLVFRDLVRDAGASDAGTPLEPTAFARTKKLVAKDTFEAVEALVRIKTRDASGDPLNRVTFALAVQPATQGKGGLVKGQGLVVAYNNGKVAVKIGGGTVEPYKDGELHNVRTKDGAEVDWPEDPEGRGVLVEILRKNSADGEILLRLDGKDLVTDRVSAFRKSRGDLEVWLGGWSTKNAKWDVSVDRVRVVRRKP